MAQWVKNQTALQPTPIFLPGKSHRGAWQATDHGVAESDMTEHTCMHIFKVILHLAFFYAQIK